MKVRKTIKSIMALGTGLTMLGATVFGAMAADLGAYPSQFIKDGQFNGLMVVGATAATEDVLGVVDIATSLQFATRKVEGATGGELSIEGDAYLFETGSSVLIKDQVLADITSTVGDEDLGVLKSTNVRTAKGTTEVTQTLDFGASGLTAVYTLNREADPEVVGDFIRVESGQPIYEYNVEFVSGLESDVESDGAWKNLQDRQIYMLGTSFTIVNAKNTTTDLELTLMTGSVTDTLQAGDTRTYEIDGKDFEVTVMIIAAADANRGDRARAKLMINGEVTDTLEEGETFTLNDGTVIGVRDILAGGSGAGKTDLLSFYLGAEKMVLKGAGGDFEEVEVNDERVNDFKAALEYSDGRLDSISFKYVAEEPIYLAAGDKISDFVEDKKAMISDSWDIMYAGLTQPATTEVVLRPSSARAYRLDFVNQGGVSYSLPLVEIDRAENKVYLGSRRRNLILDATAMAKDDMFIVGQGDKDSRTHVFEIVNLRTRVDDEEVELRDIGTGSTTKLRWNTFDTETCNPTTSPLTAGRERYTVEICYDGTDYTVKVDSAGSNVITTRYGVMINLNDNNTSWPLNLSNVAKDTTLVGLVFGVDATETESGDNERFKTSIIMAEDDELDLSRYEDVASSGIERDSDEGSDDTQGMTRYGIKVYQRDSDKADTLTVTIPSEQVSYRVYVLGAETRAVATEGAVVGGEVQRINVGKAVLDNEIANVAADNLIVVGGPCANTVAATLLGTGGPGTTSCYEDFPVGSGEGIIKAIQSGDKVAVLVAGFTAADTRNAAQVLANYGDYASQLAGKDEVVVAGTQIRAPQVVVEQPSEDDE